MKISFYWIKKSKIRPGETTHSACAKLYLKYLVTRSKFNSCNFTTTILHLENYSSPPGEHQRVKATS